MTEYFSHDYHARNDRKLRNLFQELGVAGKGIYWDLVEMLYEENGYLPFADCERIANELKVDIGMVLKVIKNYELFDFNAEKFSSKTILERLKLRNLKSKKAKLSAEIRWENELKSRNANAMRTQCERNAIKESKVKESKVLLQPAVEEPNRTTEIREFYYNAYKQKFNNPYVAAYAKDGAIFKNLLKVIEPDKLKQYITKFFDSEDSFIVKSTYDVGIFKSQINKLQAAKGKNDY